MYRRYAIFYTASGPFGSRGAAWLGWDIAGGQSVAHPDGLGIDLSRVTEAPRKYGFHGTLKAPFALADGHSKTSLLTAFEGFCATHRPASVDGLEIAALGRFLALVPSGDPAALNQLAEQIVRRFDAVRAPLTYADLARRRVSRLTPQQDANLVAWGYPYVMREFRFHMTLTGRLPKADLEGVRQAAVQYLDGAIPAPFTIDALSLVREREDGKFETLLRRPLTG
ncbi:DUF1045 domain-containing protein [Sulfitobacter sp. TSTF-M16]|uniref:DUF1045 domain-containing protein n=2 Tax=Sulfitobacter aestuariivivens TaxID=2766981 RepID=A0A927HGA8_9RHOB|nr:DUF1045 domain-containing protein [Sulfitobacter aestuariivivens]